MIETSGHDPLCKLSQPCDDETPAHGYCGLTAPRYCIHCQTWCICEELQAVKQQTIRDCIAAVDRMIHFETSTQLTGAFLPKRAVITTLRALLEGEKS